MVSHTISAALATKADPTRTTTLREREFRPEITKRYRALKGAVRTTIEDNDALRLTAVSTRGRPYTTAALNEHTIAARQDFGPGDEFDRQAALTRWLHTALQEGVLDHATQREIRNGDHYSAEYIRRAYRKGLRDAAAQARDAGYDAPDAGTDAVFAAGTAAALGALYLRAYGSIEGTVTATERYLTRTIDDQFPQASTAALADAITADIDDIGIDRGEDTARTEPVHAYAEGQLDQFEAVGVEDVGYDPEYDISTAGDSRVCAECRTKAAAGPYSLAEIRRNPTDLHPPLHVECRCRLTIG